MYRGGRPIPVFPLHGTVLFPRVVLPLHIFEPRYRLMLAEVLDSYGRIAIGNVEEEAGRTGREDVAPVMGMGRVMTYDTRSDGTSDLLLVGECRVRARSWDESEGPYRRAVFEKLEEVPVGSEERQDVLRRELGGWLDVLARNREDDDERQKLEDLLWDRDDVGFLVDFFAHHFVLDGARRQELLEELDIERRAETLRAVLGEAP